MIKKLFDAIAIMCGILMFVFAMAVDSPSNIPINICIACGFYLMIYIHFAEKYEELEKKGEN